LVYSDRLSGHSARVWRCTKVVDVCCVIAGRCVRWVCNDGRCVRWVCNDGRWVCNDGRCDMCCVIAGRCVRWVCNDGRWVCNDGRWWRDGLCF